MNRKIAKNTLIIIALAIALILLVLVIRIFASERGADNMNYLLVGIDDAGDNTDVMAVVSIMGERLSILQLPRDTYYSFGHYQNKLNQYYSYRKTVTKSDKCAMGELKDAISAQLGIRLDGFLAVRTSSFADIVDHLGGISIELTRDISFKNGDEVLAFKRGINKLSGKDALALVRHRASYKGGDLERLEVQRCVYRGLIRSLLSTSTNTQLIGLVSKISKNMIVDIPLKDAFSLLSRRGDIDYTSCEFNMLCGVALRGERGVWYYAIKRSENELLLKKIYGESFSAFDSTERFLNKSNQDFIKIYNS